MRAILKGIIALLFFSQLFPTKSIAQTSSSLPPGYYIVVAAYKLHQDSYAQSYINRISKEGVEAKYGADVGRKYLYVYLDYFTDFDESIKKMLSTRKQMGFEKAWVRVMKDQLNTNINSLTQEDKTPPQPAPTMNKPSEPSVASPSNETEHLAAAIPDEAVALKEVDPVVEDEVVVEENLITEPKPIAESSVYLSLFNATNNNQIEGEVEIVDADRARLINKTKGNEYTNLPDPKSKSGKIILIANVFGYRSMQHELLYGQIPSDSSSNFVEWAGNHYVIKFDLSRYHRGDINTLYNVYFYNDAAIMLPESKYQLNNLLTMMNENPNYKIKLHGHTNGNSRGRIITVGPSKSFFSLADDVKDGSGSAKELSEARAEVIKEWLMSEGVSGDRIEIKAWGGSRMLYDKNNTNAKKNVRVDVEILEE